MNMLNRLEAGVFYKGINSEAEKMFAEFEPSLRSETERNPLCAVPLCFFFLRHARHGLP